jgi:NTP pyrophosphatase (non-canonical NTP hydrolase)
MSEAVDFVLYRVKRERNHAVDKHGIHKTPANRDMDRGQKLAILTEEVGEVARAICDGDHHLIYGELAQVAAMAIMWMETETP